MCKNSKFISKRLEQRELCVSSVTQTSTEELVLNPLQSYEWRSNGKVNRPRRKINLENCLNSCRPVSLSLRDQTEGGDEMNVSLCLGGKCIAYTAASEGLLILSVFHQRLLLLLSAFLKGLSNTDKGGMWIIDEKLSGGIYSVACVDLHNGEESCLYLALISAVFRWITAKCAAMFDFIL